MPWLLEQSVFEAMASKASTITAEQRREFEARIAAESSGEKMSRIMSKKKGVAQIKVEGVMTEKPDVLAWLFGGGNTTYQDINQAMAVAENDDEVETIELHVDSPGGNIDGLFAVMDKIRGTTKPVKAVVYNKAASAAYGIVAQVGSIEAANDAARFGSVGVVAEMYTSDYRVAITSTNAPDKRPDPKTEEGKAVIRAELDGIADLFAERIATGRGVSAATVNAEYGRGAMLMANEALNRGMIDAVQGAESADINPAATGGDNQEANMDLNELKAKHPDVYKAAADEGIQTERDRVGAHLTLGQAYNALDVAIAAIKAGDEMNQTRTAEYIAAGANSAAIDNRQAESDDSDPGASAAEGDELSTEAKDEKASAAILAHAAELAGVELGEG